MNLKEFRMEIKMTTKPKKPVMPDFKNIQVSTKTVIAKTNARYDIQKLFESLPVTEYTVVKKKRGRKKNIYVPDPNENVPSGSIITLKYFEHLRGVDLKPKKKQGKYFRNALSIVMRVKKKLVNLLERKLKQFTILRLIKVYILELRKINIQQYLIKKKKK